MQAGLSIREGVMDYMGAVPSHFNAERTFLPAGQSSGLIHEIKPAGEVFRDIIGEAERVIRERFGASVPARS
jgi:hypothetical protein